MAELLAVKKKEKYGSSSENFCSGVNKKQGEDGACLFSFVT